MSQATQGQQLLQACRRRASTTPHVKRPWTSEELEVLADMYPRQATKVVAEALGRKASAVQKMAQIRGIKKDPSTLAAIRRECGKSNTGGMATRFKPVHGRSHVAGRKTDPTYVVWCTMHQRCNYPSHKSFKDYGGRGISVCARWSSFSAFLSDLGERPAGKTLGRIDTNGNYEPGNCRWETWQEQARNKRNTPHITALGQTKPVWAWSEQYGIRADTLKYRISRCGWTPEEALTRPVSLSSAERSGLVTYRVVKGQ